jgi:hypothetical protein
MGGGDPRYICDILFELFFNARIPIHNNGALSGDHDKISLLLLEDRTGWACRRAWFSKHGLTSNR